MIRRLPQLQKMSPAEREYLRNIRIYILSYKRLLEAELAELIPGLKREVNEKIPDQVFDSISVIRMDVNADDKIKKMFATVQQKLMKLYPNATLKRWAQNMTGHVNDINLKNLSKTTEAFDLKIEPLLTKQNQLNPLFESIVNQNVGLIRSIPEERMVLFKNALVNSITQDLPQDEIRKIIEKNFNLTANKAALIAVDQTNKFNGALNQYRQQSLGGKRYIWRTSEDERVRPDHAKLDGKIFYWDSPPISNQSSGARNHPGRDIRCRCIAELIPSDLIG